MGIYSCELCTHEFTVRSAGSSAYTTVTVISALHSICPHKPSVGIYLCVLCTHLSTVCIANRSAHTILVYMQTCVMPFHCTHLCIVTSIRRHVWCLITAHICASCAVSVVVCNASSLHTSVDKLCICRHMYYPYISIAGVPADMYMPFHCTHLCIVACVCRHVWCLITAHICASIMCL